MKPCDAFRSHRDAWSLRAPVKPASYDCELIQLDESQGLFAFCPPPVECVKYSMHPGTYEEYGMDEFQEGKCLWVLTEDGYPCAVEKDVNHIKKYSVPIKHTNLSGGKEVHSAGELWFVDKESIGINGGSGRYPIRSLEELMSVAAALSRCGFKVKYSDKMDGNILVRYIRGEMQWTLPEPKMASVE